MKPVIFLRIASVLTLIHAVLHTIGGVFGSADPGPATVAVTAMKLNTFALVGTHEAIGISTSAWGWRLRFS